MKHTSANKIARIACLLIAGSVAIYGNAAADDAIQMGTGGSESVWMNGKAAQRLGDQAGAPGNTSGGASPNVMINDKPAAVNGKCPHGTSPVPSPNVFLNGKPVMFCEG